MYQRKVKYSGSFIAPNKHACDSILQWKVNFGYGVILLLCDKHVCDSMLQWKINFGYGVISLLCV